MLTTKKYGIGIDVGSRTTKAIVWDGSQVVSKALISTGWTPEKSAELIFEKVLRGAGLNKQKRSGNSIDIVSVATGYGRVTVPLTDKTITEITAHARGIVHLLPDTRTLIDIGGQDSKSIIIEDRIVADFAMNDRCAAGSGKFLEFLAHSMGLSVDDFSELALTSFNAIQISSICTVFAESEILSLLAEGQSKSDIAVGVHKSIAHRVANMAFTLHPQPPFAFSGGVAYNKCLIREMSEILGNFIMVPANPEYVGALGSALHAFELNSD